MLRPRPFLPSHRRPFLEPLVFVAFAFLLWHYWLHETLLIWNVEQYNMLEWRLIPHDELIKTQDKPLPETYQPIPQNTNFTVISAVSRDYFDRIINLIGSLHFYEPNINLVIFDLGLTDSQRADLMCFQRVSVRFFNFGLFPPHVQQLDTYAWKGILIHQLFYDYPDGFMYLDSGIELWRSMDEVWNIIESKGYFFTVQQTTVDVIHLETALWFSVDPEKNKVWLQSNKHVSTGIMGLKKNSVTNNSPIQKVLNQWRECSLEKKCISPDGATIETHKFDQSVVSLIFLISNREEEQQLELHAQVRFWTDWMFIKTDKSISDEIAYGGPVIFFSRRHHCPKPYITKAKKISICYPSVGGNPWSWIGSISSSGLQIKQRIPWSCPEKVHPLFFVAYVVFVIIVSYYIYNRRRYVEHVNKINIS